MAVARMPPAGRQAGRRAGGRRRPGPTGDRRRAAGGRRAIDKCAGRTGAASRNQNRTSDDTPRHWGRRSQASAVGSRRPVCGRLWAKPLHSPTAAAHPPAVATFAWRRGVAPTSASRPPRRRPCGGGSHWSGRTPCVVVRRGRSAWLRRSTRNGHTGHGVAAGVAVIQVSPPGIRAPARAPAGSARAAARPQRGPPQQASIGPARAGGTPAPGSRAGVAPTAWRARSGRSAAAPKVPAAHPPEGWAGGAGHSTWTCHQAPAAHPTCGPRQAPARGRQGVGGAARSTPAGRRPARASARSREATEQGTRCGGGLDMPVREALAIGPRHSVSRDSSRDRRSFGPARHGVSWTPGGLGALDRVQWQTRAWFRRRIRQAAAAQRSHGTWLRSRLWSRRRGLATSSGTRRQLVGAQTYCAHRMRLVFERGECLRGFPQR